MNIKSSINLIRGILYLHEIIRCKSISRAAENNGIKASNLSLIISNLEKQIGARLLKRTPQGCSPTLQGQKIAGQAVELKQLIQKLAAWHENGGAGNRSLNIYVSPNLELCDCQEFEQRHPGLRLNFVEEDILADVKITNTPPPEKETCFTELHIGNGLSQKVWICCSEQNTNALKFFDFIVAKLLL